MKNNSCRLYGILCDPKYAKMQDISRRVYDPSGLAPTVHVINGGGQDLKIVEWK